MNLVKWLRKNNSKIMAIVVIVLMIGFIGGSSLSYLLRGSGSGNKTIAHYGKKIKIKQYDLYEAQNELNILKMLQADKILQGLQVPPLNQTLDLHALILGEVIFSEQQASPQIINYIRRTASNNMFRISNQQINDIYKRKAPSYYYWFLLSKEAEKAGFKVQNESARMLLTQVAQQMYQTSYSQFISRVIQSNSVSENKILESLGKLLAVLKYSHSICSSEDFTIRQLKNISMMEGESAKADVVIFRADDFAEEQESPDQDQMTKQFELYKSFVPGQVTDENPYGFGYKLPNRVQIEYIAVKLDDVKKIVKIPTFDDMEKYYNSNKELYPEFSEQVPVNPDDPNSGTKMQIKQFSEVAGMISDRLLNQKINAKASEIIQQAINTADAELQKQDANEAEPADLSTAERANLAIGYDKVSAQLRSKYDIDIYSGITGQLSSTDILSDELLSRLYLPGYINNFRLNNVLFSVDEIGLDNMGPDQNLKPKMYESIGPVKDQAEEIMAVVRIVKAVKADVPESIDTVYSTTAIVLDPNQDESDENVFSVEKEVKEDLKRFAALDVTKTRAEEFLEMVNVEDPNWENAIDEFNKLYGKTDTEPNDPNLSEADETAKTFFLQTLPSRQRYTKETMETILIQSQSDPTSERNYIELQKDAMFNNKLFEIGVQDSNEFEPQLMEFKPDMTYYVIKDISINHFWKENYENTKAIRSFSEDYVESQSMAFIHYNPENIFKRMNFRFVDENENDNEPNLPD